MFETLITPVGAVIKTIKVFYGESNGLKFGLLGLQFFDLDNNSILVAGDVSDSLSVKEIILEEGERVVGVKSRLNKGYPAFHQDI